MGDATHQLTDRLHFLQLPDLIFGREPFGGFIPQSGIRLLQRDDATSGVEQSQSPERDDEK